MASEREVEGNLGNAGWIVGRLSAQIKRGMSGAERAWRRGWAGPPHHEAIRLTIAQHCVEYVAEYRACVPTWLVPLSRIWRTDIVFSAVALTASIAPLSINFRVNAHPHI